MHLNLLITLYASFYSETLNKSGLDRLDYRRDLITQNIFREIGQKYPVDYLLPTVKVSHSQMVLRPIHISSQLAKLHAVAGIFIPYRISKF